MEGLVQHISRKKNRTRAAIMHSAKRLFEVHGFENVTADDIASTSGVCRSTFFNHFANIRDLLLAIANEEIEELLELADDTEFGKDLVLKLLYKMVDDTINYPSLFTRLTATCVSNATQNNALVKLESLIIDSLPEDEEMSKAEMVSILMGAYYGSVNHFLMNGLPMNDGSEIKQTIYKAVMLIYK